MSVFGVDFGTLNSTVALTRNGGVDVVLNEVSKRETFTFVSLGNEERYLGESGADKAVRNAANTVSCIKRFIGMRADDPELALEKRFFFGTTSQDDEGRLMFDLNNGEAKSYYPEQVLAMFLGQLSKYVDREAVIDGAAPGTHVKDCVLTVPAFYTAEQRKLMVQSAEIAGLNCMALINETSAAGIDYGIFRGSSLPDKEEDAQTVAIVDLGYGATTVTIGKFWKSNMKVLTHVVEKQTGTRELDYYLSQHFAKEIQKKYKVDVNENKRARVRILQACEKVKTLLSGNMTTPLNLENLMDIDVNIAGFTRDEMEAACSEVYERLAAVCKEAVKQAGLDLPQIHKVEVIGGGCRIPMFKKTLEDAFGQPPAFTLNASESVARGCAITAAVYSPKFRVREYVVHEAPQRAILLGYNSSTTTAVSSVSFLPQVNKVITILNKTDHYPKTLELTFDRREEFDLFWFYDEEKSQDLLAKKQPLLLGSAKIGTTDKENNGKVKVEIKFHPSGLVTVESASATEEYEVEVEEEKPSETEGEPPVKVKVTQKKTRRIALTATPVVDILGHKSEVVLASTKTEADLAARDRGILNTKEAKNSLESYIYDYRTSLSEGGQYFKYIKKDEATAFVELATKYENWLYDDEYTMDDYQTRLDELKKTGLVAQKRFRAADEIGFELKQHVKKIVVIIQAAQEKKGKFHWISEDELFGVNTLCNKAIDKAEQDVKDYLAADCAQDPTVTPGSLAIQLMKLQSDANVVFNKPEPKPEPKEEIPEDEAKEGEAKEGDAKEGEAKEENADEKPKAEEKAEEGPKVDAELD